MKSLVVLASLLAPAGGSVRSFGEPSEPLQAQVPIGDPDDDDEGEDDEDDEEDEDDDEEPPWQVRCGGLQIRAARRGRCRCDRELTFDRRSSGPRQ